MTDREALECIRELIADGDEYAATVDAIKAVVDGVLDTDD